MLTDLIRSRLMLADVSADNTNVGAEIATRYAWVPSGTVLVHLKGTKVPFDFARVQITDYSHRPQDVIPDAQARIAQALRQTLKFGSVDNPFFEHAQKFAGALGTPGKPTELGNLLVDAELAVRRRDLTTAIAKYGKAERIHPDLASLHRRRATLFVEGGAIDAAQKEMRTALKIEPNFPEGDRWLEQIKRGRVPKPSSLDRIYFKELVKIDPKRPTFFGQLGKQLYSPDKGKYLGFVGQPEYQQTFKKLKGRKKCSLKDAERIGEINIKGMDFGRREGAGRGGRSRGGFGRGFSGL
jgi:tetratricopeptide (TPR) repeat protein